MTEAHVFQDCEIDQAGRAHAVAIRVRRAIRNEVEAEFSLGRFDAAVGFARLRTKAAQFRLGINDRAVRNFLQRLS